MVSVDRVLAEELDQASRDFVTHTQLVERLTAAGELLDHSDYDRHHLDALRAAFCFRLTADGTFRGDFRGGDPQNPWPRVLAEVPADVLEIWDGYAGNAQSPAVRAHLHHVLTSARVKPVHVHARSAIMDYRAAVPVFLAVEEYVPGRARAADCLRNALGLAVGMNQRDLRTLVVQDILDRVAEFIDGQDPALGLVHELLDALRAARLEDAAVRDLIERANARADNVHMKVAFLQMLRSMDPDPAAQKTVDARIVTTMIDQAQQEPNKMSSHMLLTDAATAARDAGLTALHDDAIKKIQAISTSDLGMVPISRSFQFPKELIDAPVAEVDAADSLSQALWTIARGPVPSGRISVAEKAAKLLVQNAPFASSVARVRINPGGPVAVSAGSSDGLANTRAQYQVLHMSTAGIAIAKQLERVAERFAPSEADLIALFDHPLTRSHSKTRMLVHAFQHFWAEEDDAAVHLALPRVEDLLREIERDRGVGIVNVAKGATPGGLSQLGALISAMPEAGFDEDWTRYFSLLLTDGVQGLNLRNNIGHGLCDCPPRHHVALALHTALYLLAVAHGKIVVPAPAAS